MVVAGTAVFDHPDGIEAAVQLLKEQLSASGV